MVSITIHDVPDEVLAVYAARARKAGVPLEEYLSSEVLFGLDPVPMAELVGQIRQDLAESKVSITVDDILAAIDAGRR